MHFFRAREAADEWVAGRESVVALSLDDAFELARIHWVERSVRSQACEVIDRPNPGIEPSRS